MIVLISKRDRLCNWELTDTGYVLGKDRGTNTC